MTTAGASRVDGKSYPPEVIAVEEPGDDGIPQALRVRVGPVFDGSTERREPGIWVTYQERYQASDLSGPLLLSPATWRALNTAVEERLRKPSGVRRLRDVLRGR
jgi:hypothetical protein